MKKGGEIWLAKRISNVKAEKKKRKNSFRLVKLKLKIKVVKGSKMI